MHISTSGAHNPPHSQISRFKLIRNSLTHTVVKASKSCNLVSVFKFLGWLKINERV